MTIATGIIADIIGSRDLPDRAAAQQAILDSLARACEGAEVLRPVWPTVGDEFQLVVADPPTAVRVTGLAHLLLPATLSLRFGIGTGTVVEVGGSTTGSAPPIQDGSAWWAAREAIQTVHRLREGGQDAALTWFRSGAPSSPGQAAWPEEETVNALLLLRDHVIARMKSRERRIATGLLAGSTQVEIARSEGITQSAVSQNAHRSGAATLVEVHRLLASGEVRR
ncbi:SatD family protein [Actinomyces provencensis]|uniref:SatD family protein n=1 Tax=Actinomyces provencensis TaxID=1720198 RepID=UPI00096A86FC|nr:SatD family protein [Actinomyces provencensis]